MSKLKELFSDSLVYGISSVLARFINYLMVPLHTKAFETAQYGVVSLIYAAITFLNVVFTFGMESAYLRYAKDRENARNTFTTIQLFLLGLASLLVFILWVGAPWVMPLMSLNASQQPLFLFMLGIIWFDTLALVPFAELRLVRKSWSYAAIRTANVLLVVGLNFYFILGLQWGIEAVFLANLIAAAATTVVVSIITAPMWKGSWERGLLRQALRFGAPFVPAGLGYAVNEVLDRFFLNRYLSEATAVSLYGPGTTPEDVVGIYGACYKLGVFMLLLIQMFRMAWQPFFLRHADGDDAPQLYADVFLYFNGIAAVVFLVISLLAFQIVQIPVPLLDAYIIAPEYWQGLTIVPILLGAYWFQGWYMNFSAGVFIEEKTKILPFITLSGAVITVIANIILIPMYGMVGAALATLCSYASMAFMLYYKVQQVYPVPYRLGYVAITMCWVMLLLLLKPTFTEWLQSSGWAIGGLLMAGIAGVGALMWEATETG